MEHRVEEVHPGSLGRGFSALKWLKTIGYPKTKKDLVKGNVYRPKNWRFSEWFSGLYPFEPKANVFLGRL